MATFLFKGFVTNVFRKGLGLESSTSPAIGLSKNATLSHGKV
jgi:hypothetical protein